MISSGLFFSFFLFLLGWQNEKRELEAIINRCQTQLDREAVLTEIRGESGNERTERISHELSSAMDKKARVVDKIQVIWYELKEGELEVRRRRERGEGKGEMEEMGEGHAIALLSSTILD